MTWCGNISASEPLPVGPPGSGWAASLALGFEARHGRTVLAHRRQRGPLAVQRGFYPEGAPCHCYLLHPPGGVVGGDQLAIDIATGSGAHALITTPGAAKCYRSAGPVATQRQTLQVSADGVLEWLPQETILFPGAQIGIGTTVMLSGNARFIGWDIACLGRPAIDEAFDRGQAVLTLEIERDARPLLRERLAVTGSQCQTTLRALSGLRGYPVTATFLATGASADDLAAARAVLPADASALLCGATRLDDLLVARALAWQVEPVLQCFRQLWAVLRPRLLGLPPCPPRIWAT